MTPDTVKLVWDAVNAAERIERWTAGKGFSDYLKDDLLRSAVERQFEIIGEAFVQIRRADPDFLNSLPEAKRIIAFRNVLIHGYSGIDDRLVWGVIESNLADLLNMLRPLLSGGP